MKRTLNTYLSLFLSLTVIFSMSIVGCEGPAGADGSQGPEGPQGPVGPAGENGSVMYGGPGEPSSDVGATGDYYLDTTSGELYGPKDEQGWGEPIIVLIGENGSDGQDGADGEDGSQIYSGTTAPDASMGDEGDYYLNTSTFDLYGPKTSSGWGSPLNLKGADGNANVTRYIFPGHDFSSSSYSRSEISDVENPEESAWIIYLVIQFSNGIEAYHVPGYGSDGDSEYLVYHETYDSAPESFFIGLVSGPGESYDNIYIVRIEASNSEDLTSVEDSLIPDDLDTSDYEAVAKYYGFGDIKTSVSRN